jgi:UDP-2,3-diacylglucosamine hydrolase
MKERTSRSKTWFISDLHLRSLNERNGQYLLRFLSYLRQAQDTKHLYLLGDIFDLWLSDHSIFEQKFRPIVEELASLVESGVGVTYFEGNHDMHIDKYFEQLGIEVQVDPLYTEIGGKTFRLEHGDLMNPDDKAYDRYRRFARHPWTEQAIHHLPGAFWNWLGTEFSKESRKHSTVKRLNREAELQQIIHRYAERVYQDKKFDFIITGHIHLRDQYNLKANANAVSINLGSWFEEPHALLNDSSSKETLQWVSVQSIIK